MLLMVFLSMSSTNFCSRLTSSISKGESNFSSISHSINGCPSYVWISLSTSCLASKNTDILPILERMIYSFGPDRSDSRLTNSSSTAEWQIWSCCVIVELMFLLSCCSTNSSTKLIFQIIHPDPTLLYTITTSKLSPLFLSILRENS